MPDYSYECTDAKFRYDHSAGVVPGSNLVVADLRFENEHGHDMGWHRDLLLHTGSGLTITDGEYGLEDEEAELVPPAVVEKYGKNRPGFDIYNTEWVSDMLAQWDEEPQVCDEGSEYSFLDTEFYEVGQGGTVYERKFVVEDGVLYTGHNDGGLSGDVGQDTSKQEVLSTLRTRLESLRLEVSELEEFLAVAERTEKFEVREQDEEDEEDLDDEDEDSDD